MKNTGTGGRFLDEAGLPVLDNEGEEIYQYRVKPRDTFKWTLEMKNICLIHIGSFSYNIHRKLLILEDRLEK